MGALINLGRRIPSDFSLNINSNLLVHDNLTIGHSLLKVTQKSCKFGIEVYSILWFNGVVVNLIIDIVFWLNILR